MSVCFGSLPMRIDNGRPCHRATEIIRDADGQAFGEGSDGARYKSVLSIGVAE